MNARIIGITIIAVFITITVLVIGAVFKWFSWKFFFSFLGIILGLTLIFIGIYAYTNYQNALREAQQKKRFKNTSEVLTYGQQQFKIHQTDHFLVDYFQSTTHGQPGVPKSTVITIYGHSAIQRRPFIVSINTDNPDLGLSIMPYYYRNDKITINEVRESLATNPDIRDKRTTKIIDEATGRTVEKTEELTPQTAKKQEEEEGEV